MDLISLIIKCWYLDWGPDFNNSGMLNCCMIGLGSRVNVDLDF